MAERKEKASFLSPLDIFIADNCSQCNNWAKNCDLRTENGLKRMELCIRLYCNQPPDVTQILKDATKALQDAETSEAIAESDRPETF